MTSWFNTEITEQRPRNTEVSPGLKRVNADTRQRSSLQHPRSSIRGSPCLLSELRVEPESPDLFHDKSTCRRDLHQLRQHIGFGSSIHRHDAVCERGIERVAGGVEVRDLFGHGQPSQARTLGRIVGQA